MILRRITEHVKAQNWFAVGIEFIIVVIGVFVDPSRAGSAMESDYQGLFSSKRFEGLLHNRVYNTSVAIERMESLKADTRVLIDRLESRLASL